MRNQYKLLAEKYDQVLEADQKPTLRVGSDGTKKWYQNDKLHRLNGPAIEYRNGDKAWFQNDKRHRLDGPAMEYPDGTKEWYQNDKLHRLDGPAMEYPDGSKEWYIDGKQYSEEEFQTKINTLKGLEALSRIRSK